MSLPQVTITELDGALGVLPASAGNLLAVVGVSSSGTAGVPATFARPKDVVASFGVGPGVEAAAYALERFGRPVIFVKASAATNLGSASAVTFTGTGTSVVTIDATVKPVDDYEVRLKVANGGTIATAGITLQYSLDGGRNYSGAVALGTANTYTIPGAGVKFNFAAGTLVTGDIAAATTTAPTPTAAEIGTALDALNATAVQWEIVHIAAPVDGTIFDTIETKIAAAFAAGKPRAWIGNFRVPNSGESEASYLTAFGTAFSGKGSVVGMVCAGACKMISSVTTGRKYRRPASFYIAARQGSVDAEVNVASINLGSATGVSIRDDNGNQDEHDEYLSPGLDDARAATLRTWNEVQGVYITRPRLLCPDGSDFTIMPYRRVMNLGEVAVRSYLVRRLNQPVAVDSKTGRIREEDALEIEAGANAALAAALSGKASDWTFVLSRTDNLLSTKTLTGDVRIIPLGYPEFITVTIGFVNPANQIVRV